MTLNETGALQKRNLEMSHQRGPPGVRLSLTLEGILEVSWEEAAAEGQ